MAVFYEGVQVGTRRLDFFVEGVVLVELKAVSGLDHLHLVQLRNYLQVFELEVGLLLNFGARSLAAKVLGMLSEWGWVGFCGGFLGLVCGCWFVELGGCQQAVLELGESGGHRR